MNVINAQGETMKIKREAVRQMRSRDTTTRINKCMEKWRILYSFGLAPESLKLGFPCS